MHWSLLREKSKCPVVTGYYMPGQKEVGCLPTKMKSSQIKINVYGGSWKTPFIALYLLLFIFIIFIVSLETTLSRRLLSKTILFTFIHNKDSYIQNRHESVISISHLWSASLPMCSSASVDSRTGLLSKLCLRTSSYYPITSLHFASTQCSNTIPDSNFK